MAVPAIPQNLYISQGNRQIFIKWAASAGATSYSVQRSLDGVNFSSLSSPAVPEYLDSSVSVGVMYWYQVASTNGSGTSSYSSSVQMVPAPTGEMSLYELRLAAKQKSDRVDSNFVETPEWNRFLNLAQDELYDILVDIYEDFFMAPRAQFTTDGTTFRYQLPDGALSFTGIDGNSFVASPFHKLLGVDLGVSSANNAFVTMNKFNLLDRNNFIYPNSGSTIYGVFNMQYRVLDKYIEFVPTPTANQKIQLLYIPRLSMLLRDTDLTTIGGTGWLQYVIVRAAKYALDKEEQDTQGLDGELIFLKARIEESAMNRDAGQPDRITDIRQNWGGGGNGFGFNGPIGGF